MLRLINDITAYANMREGLWCMHYVQTDRYLTDGDTHCMLIRLLLSDCPFVRLSTVRQALY